MNGVQRGSDPANWVVGFGEQTIAGGKPEDTSEEQFLKDIADTASRRIMIDQFRENNLPANNGN